MKLKREGCLDLDKHSHDLLDKFNKSRYIMKCGVCGRLLEYFDELEAMKQAGVQRKCMRCKAMNCTSLETINFKGSTTYILATFKDRLTGNIEKGGINVVRRPGQKNS